MWRYIGPHLDPHRFTYYPGMTRHNADRTADLLDALLPKDIEDGVAELHRLTDHTGAKCSALIYRHDGAACGFVATDPDMLATVLDMTHGAKGNFPELFGDHKLPFSVIRDATPIEQVAVTIAVTPAEPAPTCEPSKSAPNLSAASASSTSKTAAPSKPGKRSQKSSA